ncbi:MAG: exosortase J [Acidobacteriaceae bacterium]|nr:exosortase J [Acidobacteriaceae bacterium]
MSTLSMESSERALRSSESDTPGLLSPLWAATFATLLTLAGVFSVYSTVLYLWALWTTDPLKSIGGFIPVVSLVLVLRVWRSLGWEMNGTWWGLPLLAATIALVHLRDHAIIELVVTPSWAVFVPPHSLVAFLYVSGAVLLFGGTRLYRAALFPICLIWFVNPVPHTFNLWVDLPLQHASALIARGFAHAMGQQLSPDQLRLMFTPEFGMFIAPGCNGIRGAITMGFLALIAGYVYHFRPRVIVAITLCAVMLGYLFNLVRLCVLVLYYIVALHIPWLQSRAEMGDYIIGACLFFGATLLLFHVIRRFNATHDLRLPQLPQRHSADPMQTPKSFVWRWAALFVVLLYGSVGYARAVAHMGTGVHALDDPNATGVFPEHVGSYTLQRKWNEHLVTGALIFYWADYAPANGGPVISVGISPVLGAHDTLICHAARGEDWLWHGDLRMPTADGADSFSGSFFNDGATQYLEATTVCSGASCGQYSSARKHFGLIYSKPDTQVLLTQSPTRPIPVLLRTETDDAAMAPDLARKQLTESMTRFLSEANLSKFTAPYR